MILILTTFIMGTALLIRTYSSSLCLMREEVDPELVKQLEVQLRKQLISHQYLYLLGQIMERNT